MLKRILAVLATATLAIGLALGGAMSASAHTPSVAATCSTLTVKMDSYGSNTTNKLTVKIDGNVVENTTFANAFAQKVYTFSGTVAHTYVVEVDAQDAGWDRLEKDGTAIKGTTTPCTTAVCTNPLTNLKNFTIVTEETLTVSNGGAHVEGTAAVGTNLIVNNPYHVQNNHDGTGLPVVDGKATGLLVGGKVTLNTSGEAFQVNAGATRVGTTSGGSVVNDNRYRPVSGTDAFVRMSANATLADVTASGLFASTFPNLFTALRSSSDAIANYNTGDVNFVTTSANGGDGQKVTLSAGVVNVLRVNSSQLSAITKLWFDGGVVPSVTTPFIIDVTGGGSVTTTAPVLMNIDAHYVLWNFKATTLNISTTEFIKGSILAPRAQLNLTSGGIEGQIAAKSMVITSGAEIHHIGYTPCVTPPTSVSGAATATAEYCDTTTYAVKQGAITATAKTGVLYELWNAAKSAKIADLTAGTAFSVAKGTYYVKVLPASSSYTVSDANTWIQVVVGAYTGDCTAPQSVSGAATVTAEYCATADYTVQQGSITATAKTGVKYELYAADKTTKIADLVAGTAYKVNDGSYYVKVLPTSAAYTVSDANTWIPAVVGDYTGVCAESVTGAATASAEYCDTDDYEVKNGSVTATVKTGVVYELYAADKTTKIADLTGGVPYAVANGTYYVKVKPATDKYQVTAENEWIQVVVGQYTLVCAQDVSGAASATAEYCDSNVYEVENGSVTATVKSGVTYELWSADKGTKIADLTAGTPYSVANGTYYVKVKPATSKFVVSPGNEWIQAVVGAYTGDCTEGVSGSASSSAEYCTVDYEITDGSVTANVANGVVYDLYASDKTTKIADLTAGTAYPVAHGTYWVKVEPATSKFSVSADNTWIKVVVGEYTGVCAQPVTGSATPSAEYCDVDYAVKQGSVTANAATGVEYALYASNKTTKIADLTAGTAYAVDGGTYYVKVIASSDDYQVLPGDMWIEVVVGTYTGECDEPVSGAVKTAAEACSADDYSGKVYNVENGSITATAVTGVRYELWNADKTTKIADLTAGTAYPVAGGTYFVKVLPATGDYTVLPGNEWIEAQVAKNTSICEVIGDPIQFQQCVVNAANPLVSDWTSNLTIVAATHVQYRVYFSDGVTWVDQGVWAAGTYDAGTAKLPYDTLVKVVAEADGGWSLLAPKSWNYTVQKPFNCNLPEFGIVTPVVTFAQTCEAGASYALSIVGGVPGTVLWSVNGGPQTTQLGTFTASAPSTVKIVATPAPGSGFDGNGLPRTFERTFTDPAACDLETLAFTGQNVTPYLVIAVILFQAGLALVAVQFIRARRRARHLIAG